MRRRILVDADGVLCDFASAYLSVVSDLFGRRHDASEIVSFDFRESVVTAEEDAAVWRYLAVNPGVVRGLEPLPGVREALRLLRGLGDVVCVTSPQWTSAWAQERFEWLADFGFDRKTVVFASDKSLITGDVLIDDALHNLDEWRQAHWRGFSVLVDQPWNRQHTHHRREAGAFGAACYLETLRAVGAF